RALPRPRRRRAHRRRHAVLVRRRRLRGRQRRPAPLPPPRRPGRAHPRPPGPRARARLRRRVEQHAPRHRVAAQHGAARLLGGLSEDPHAPGPVMTRIRYGTAPSQFGDLRLLDGGPRPVAVLLHGGFWRAAYGLEELDGFAEAVTAECGVATWNLEYRRIGEPGGGWRARRRARALRRR